ncbi:uncharacterized protein BP5553_10239 [Venustampulla echinocandica]|uniref:F-box domain-containing protein n=1 Tax=Venustampulla echinocandica TaxID=2656787 RepID=A0A370T9P1_9HELO|nr:uncharacterized protein BP5553_10239 [Venustampulla echinocandica]RDL30361.1 hypothetical protein BP5553_10239 [Venustampulla echinocandica]
MKRILSNKFKHLVRLSKSSTPDPPPDSTLSATAASADLPHTIPILERQVAPVSVSVPVPENLLVEPAGDIPQLNATLENLPPEIRRQLLSVLGLEELSALVHASSTFHQQYLLDRKSLLCKCLATTLRSATVDACAVYRSSLASFLDARTGETVTQFLKSYQNRRSSTQYSILNEGLTEDEVVGMIAFHSSIIKALARHYTDWALINLATETKDSQSHGLLSRTEETRLLRALYRFQLCCNLFGTGRHGILLEPGKVKYNQIFDDIRWDVHEENPKFDGQRPPTPDGAFDLDNSWARSSLLKGTISRGLELLYTVFFTVRDHAHLVSTMQEHITWPEGYFLEGDALGETAQLQRRQEWPSSRDQKEQRRDPLPFEGDNDRDANGPPLAWTLIWQGTYSNLYGHYVEDNIRRWGYVMWDAVRLERTGAKEVLARQWEADWGDGGPRDTLV